VCAPPPGLGVGGWCWLGYRLPIGWCYWDYPIAPISPYHVVGLLAHIPTGAPPAGPWQELVWQFALERLVGSGSHVVNDNFGRLLASTCIRSCALAMAGNMPNSVPTIGH
jgi:hypothetical protein